MFDLLQRFFDPNKISNRQKSTFFKTYFNQRFSKNGKDLEPAFRIAADQARLKLSQALEVLNEVTDYQWEGLDTTKDGAVIAWFKKNSNKLAQRAERFVRQETV